MRAGDWAELGIWALQDHDKRAKRELRQQLVGMRVHEIDQEGPLSGIVQYATEDDKGTLGDLHPWRFWQTSDRENRYSGSWSYAFAVIVGEAKKSKGGTTPGGGPKPGGAITPGVRSPSGGGGGREGGTAESGPRGKPKAYPIKDDKYTSDSRYSSVEHEWLRCFPTLPKGTLMIGMAGTEEQEQHNLLLHADPRLVAVNIEGSALAGTIVCDLQPRDEYCMGGKDAIAGVGGRTARLQSMMRVIPLQQGGGNGIAWQLGASGQDALWGYGLTFGKADESTAGGRKGDTTDPPDSNGDRPPADITPSSGGPGGDTGTSGISPTSNDNMGVQGQTSKPTVDGGSASKPLAPGGAVPPGAGGRGGGGGESGDFNPETGKFKPKQTRGHAVGMAARRDMFGPLDIGHVSGDKHRIGSTKDGDAINSLHLSRDANFYLNQEYDGPLYFEEIIYPEPGPLPGISRVHLSWDPNEPQASGAMGQWKWFAEVPFLTPPRGGPPPTTPPSVPPPTDGPPTVTTPTPSSPGGPPATTSPGGDSTVQRPTGNANTGGSSGATSTAGGSGGAKDETPGKRHGQKRLRTIRSGADAEQEWLEEWDAIEGKWRYSGPVPWMPGWDPNKYPWFRGPRLPSTDYPYAPSPSYEDLERKIKEFEKEERDNLRKRHAREHEAWRRELEKRRFGWPKVPLKDWDKRDDAGPFREPFGGSDVPPDPPRTPGAPWGHKRRLPADLEDLYSTPNAESVKVSRTTVMVGDAPADYRHNLFLVHHPLMEAFTSLSFRPQLEITGNPDYRHNPDYGSLAARDEIYRPQVVTLHSFGAMDDGDWDYTLPPGSSGRVRGGIAQGGIVYTPPNVTLKEIYDGENNTTNGYGGSLVCSGVGFAPGVTAFFGRPDRDGCLKAKSVTIKQDTATNEGLKINQFDSTRTERTLIGATLDQASGERMVVFGGQQAIQIPVGTTAQRPSAFTPASGHIRINTDIKPNGDHVEYYDGQHNVWRQLDHGGGGGGGPAVPTGAILPYGAATAPTGYLLCDGASYTTAAQAALFAVIGYTYGGAGANFNVPDLRLKFPQGSDYGANPPGGTGGSQTPAITDPGHTHTVGATAAMPGPNAVASTAATGNSTTGVSIADGRPPFLTLGYIIKA